MALVAKVTMKPGWDSQRGLEEGLAEMATDIHTRASILAPKDTRALVNSGKIERKNSTEYVIKFGGGKVPYARIRHYINKKNPQTLGYLAKAADSVSRGDKSKYFRNKVG